MSGLRNEKRGEERASTRDRFRRRRLFLSCSHSYLQHHLVLVLLLDELLLRLGVALGVWKKKRRERGR